MCVDFYTIHIHLVIKSGLIDCLPFLFLFSNFGVPVMQRDTSSSDVSASHVGRVRRRRHPTEVSIFFPFALYCALFFL
jgi:hypothetical protein